MRYNIKNQVVVISGGGSGIGLAAAMAFTSAGAKVIILGRHKKKLLQAQSQIGAHGECYIYRADVSKAHAVKRVFTLIAKRFKRIDILVNCAGFYGPIGPFAANDLEFWQAALNTNLLGTVHTCHAVLPMMLKQRRGKIVNMSGGGAVQAFPNFSAYASSKAAVVRFTENLAQEYKSHNIQINSIAPGAINTQVLEEVLKTGARKVGEDFYRKSLEQKRTGGDSVENAAELILFLCLPGNKLTGKLISAKWDAWRSFTRAQIGKLNSSALYTLRRIDGKYFHQSR